MTSGVFHGIADNVENVVFSTDFVHANDVWMLELCGCSRLSKKLFGFNRIQLSFARNFDGNDTVELTVSRFPNSTESTYSNLLQELKTANRMTRRVTLDKSVDVHQTKTAAAGWANHIGQRRFFDNLNRVLTVWTT